MDTYPQSMSIFLTLPLSESCRFEDTPDSQTEGINASYVPGDPWQQDISSLPFHDVLFAVLSFTLLNIFRFINSDASCFVNASK
jgi:hypothetical protein